MTEIRNQKDNLAKLMATEDLTIIHKKIPTAYFDIKNRILACPTLKNDISPSLYDLFMGHEVGHALYTPLEGLHSTLKENRTLKGYLNVIEDVRIERKIKDKFAGLRKSFYAGYNDLMERDFFGLKGRDLQTISLIDKINLISKVGSRVTINLTEEEQVFLDAAYKCETWEDVVQVATAIYEWSKENETRNDEDESIVPTYKYDIEDEDDEDFEDMFDESEQMTSESSEEEGEESDEFSSGGDTLPDLDESEEEENDTSDTSDEESEESDTPSETKNTGGKEGGQGTYDDEDGARESLTEHNAHNNEEQFVSEENMAKTYKDMSVVFKENNFNDMIVSYKDVIKDFQRFNDRPETDSYYYSSDKDAIKKSFAKGEFTGKKLIKKNKAVVNHMAKEFEMRQSAQRSKYAFTGKTGKLDMNRISKYQIVDDVFKRAVYLPEGKNHGVQVLIDWSGSISKEAADLLEQALILVEFCRKVGIPHRVYLFTDCYSYTGERRGMFDRKTNSYLIELFSNEMSLRDFNTNMTNIGQLFNYYKFGRTGYGRKWVENHNNWFDGKYDIEEDNYWYDFGLHIPQVYNLGGTPLDNSLVAMRQLIVEFNKNYNIEKSILTLITDGESHSSDLLNWRDLVEDEHGQMGESYGKKERFILDPYNKKPYILEQSNYYNSSGFKKTANLLDWLSKSTGVDITGYFVVSKKSDFYWLKDQAGLGIPYSETDAHWRDIRKVGKVYDAHGYNRLFVTAPSALGVDGSEGLDDELIDAKKVKVMAAFKRNMKSKTTSRFLATEFIKEIA